MRTTKPTVLLTGTTGYVGAHLLKSLTSAGHKVRCLVRRPDAMQSVDPAKIEIMCADVLNASTLEHAFDGIHTAYYLIHCMGEKHSFEDLDRRAAHNFADAAGRAGIRRIIYLGGLGDSNAELSPHLRSRQEVGEILRSSGITTLEFRASIIIGSGSLSFEMIRALVERLPIMITPRWVTAPAQPIGIDDLIQYLLAGLDIPAQKGRVYELGGMDTTTYCGLMLEYARQRRLRRLIIRVPVLTPWLSSLWLGLITPLYARVGRILIESIRHPTLIRDTSALKDFQIRPMGFQQAIATALAKDESDIVKQGALSVLADDGAQK